MAGHNFFVVGGGAAAAVVTVGVAIVDIDVTAVVINNQYYNGCVIGCSEIHKSLHGEHSSGRTWWMHAKIETSAGKCVLHGCHTQKRRKFLCIFFCQ
jgi:hypothetical protein